MARITLADVSRATEVSIATASRALSPREHPDVSPATRERIREAADQLGYRPSVAARAFRSRDFRAVSIIVPDGQWGWWEQAVRAAHGAARAQGCNAFVQPTTALRGDSGDIADVIAALEQVPTEGVLLFGSAADARMLASAEALRLPVVAIDNSADAVVVPTFASDSARGVRLAVQHLVETGRRRIAYVGARGDLLFQRERREGHRAALAAAGIPADPDLVVRDERADDLTAPGLPAFDALLGSGAAVDAVLCESDRSAAVVLRSLRRAGLRVPDDVSVVGFDDSQLAVALDPPLTSVHQPFDQLGTAAIELLLEQIDGAGAPVGRTLLPPTLTVRGSA